MFLTPVYDGELAVMIKIIQRKAGNHMKGKKILLTASIIGTVSIIVLLSVIVFSFSTNAGRSSEPSKYSISTISLLLFILLSIIAVVFSWIGYKTNNRIFALIAGILYTVTIVLVLDFFYFNIVQMGLCYAAFSAMRGQ